MTAKLLENVSCGLQRAEKEMNRTDGRWGFSGLYRYCSSQILTSQSLWVKKETWNTQRDIFTTAPLCCDVHGPCMALGIFPAPQWDSPHPKATNTIRNPRTASSVPFMLRLLILKRDRLFNYGGNFREGREVGVSKSLTWIKASLFPSRRLRCLVQNWRDRRWLPVFHS